MFIINIAKKKVSFRLRALQCKCWVLLAYKHYDVLDLINIPELGNTGTI